MLAGFQKGSYIHFSLGIDVVNKLVTFAAWRARPHLSPPDYCVYPRLFLDP